MIRRRGALAITAVATALATAVATTARAEDVNLGFDFDDAPIGYSDARAWNTGCFRATVAKGCIQTSQDGALRPVPRGDGSALRFPVTGSAVVRVRHDEAFNPGRADFTITALVRLSPEQVQPGANVIQKGLHDSSRGQWKLQVDAGVPSCRVSGTTAKTRIATAEARAPRRLTDGVWTSVRCVRDGSRLRLYVDGTKVDSSGHADVDIDNRHPVLIGGKHAGTGNDQFRGDLDDVSVTFQTRPRPDDERPSPRPAAPPDDGRPDTGAAPDDAGPGTEPVVAPDREAPRPR